MNIFEALRESHEQQRNLANQLITTSGSSDERKELLICSKMNYMLTQLLKIVICIFH
jgi:hypothetical protein